MKDLRVSFKLSNGTYLDAVLCRDLYADQIEQARSSNSTRAKEIAESFQDRAFVCPNVTSFDFLKENDMKTWVTRCEGGVQNIYAGDLECNERLSNPVSNYKYSLLTISSTFDADYYHQNQEPLIIKELQSVALEEDASIKQIVTGIE